MLCNAVTDLVADYVGKDIVLYRVRSIAQAVDHCVRW